MRFALILVVLFAAQPANSFDFSSISSFWETVKNQIETFVRGNGTLTDEQVSLLEKLNNTSADQADFKSKLMELRGLVKTQMEESQDSVDKKALEKMLKKFGKKVRQQIRKTGDNLEEVNEKLNVTGNFYQGDMMLTDEQMSKITEDASETVEKRQAFVDARGNKKWSTVYYSYNTGLKAHTIAVSELAIKFWQSNTCINFLNTTAQANRINIIEGSGCYSYVGVIGGVQPLSLGTGCDSVGTAAHEFGHALGFYHTQSRYDRDNSITLVPANVQSGWLDQFTKQTTSTNNNYNMPYDYGSVMQYAGTSASANGQPTMVAKVSQYQDTMGSDIPSFYDVSMMNELYGCKTKCASSTTKCQNGGFPHPRNCAQCICPSGFGGALCDQRPSGCGATLVASKTAATASYKVGNGTYTVKDEFEYCNYWITAPAAADRIQVTITTYRNNACTSGCVYGGIELKWKSDVTLTGSRYCCSSDVKETVTSETNAIRMVAFNRYGAEQFTISYKIV